MTPEPDSDIYISDKDENVRLLGSIDKEKYLHSRELAGSGAGSSKDQNRETADTQMTDNYRPTSPPSARDIEDASEFLMGTSLSKAERKSLWLSWSADELLTMLESRKRDEVWTARIKMRLAELEREGRGFEDKGGTTDEID